FKNRDDWAPRAARGKLALYEVALHGKPNTGMMARGGFRDLSDHEVMAAVDYMVAQAGFSPGLRPEPMPAAPAAPLAAEPSLAGATSPCPGCGRPRGLRTRVGPPHPRISTTRPPPGASPRRCSCSSRRPTR